ncbi:MAG: DUF3467 domain-containing protein [Miltoncostaeaceae bacterium]
MSDPKPRPSGQARPAQPTPGAFANLLRIARARSEFHLSFGQTLPSNKQAALVGSIVTTPEHAKSMLQALAKAVADHEAEHGEVVAAPGKPAQARKQAPAKAPAQKRKPASAARKRKAG